MLWITVAALAAAAPQRGTMAWVMAESNLEKRSRRALEFSAAVLMAAVKAYDAGNWEQTMARVEEMRQGVALARKSLKDSGKDPRRSPRYFKDAEIRTRQLLREFEDFRQKMGIEERERLEPVRAYLQESNEEFLQSVMGSGKQKQRR